MGNTGRSVQVKPVAELTASEYQQVRSLNMREGGSMRYELEGYRRNKRNDINVVMVKAEDKLLGWALVKERGSTYFYVRKSERRKGIGTLLLEEVRKVAETPIVHPWDRASVRFFKNFVDKVSVTPGREWYMTSY